MNLLDLMVTIRADDQASPVIDGVGAGTIAKGAAVGALVSQGISAAAGAIVDFGKETIQTGMDFDSAMSQVAATMGVTTDDIGQLRDTAKEMGSSTKFSATEAAEAMNYMALAGYDANTTMEMLPTVLDLAAAGGMDLAAASDMVTDSQTALGLTTEETTTLVDQMAQTASKSNTSVAQLGDAILTVGGTAKNLSGGMTEMNTVLGVMADNGIKGSEAGTHLRNVILSLSAPTDNAAAAMAELGVSAVDADGNLRPLQDTMADFNKAFENMTQEEKTQALSKIFNKTDLAAVNALLDTSVDRWDQLGAAIGDSAGAASTMATTMQDNLEGAVTSMNSAIEGVQIGLSEMMTPALREMVDTATTGFQQMAQQLSAGDLLGAFTTLGETVANLASQFLTALPSILDAGLQMVTGLVQGLAQGAPQLMQAAVQAVTGLAQAIVSNLPQMIAAALNLIVGLAQGFIQALPTLIAAIPPLIQGIIQALLAMLPMLAQAGVQLFSALVQNLPAILVAILTAVPQIITMLIQAIVMQSQTLAQAGVELFMGIVSNIPAIITGIVGALPAIVDGIVSGFMGLLNPFNGVGQGMANETVSGMSTLPGQTGEVFGSAYNMATTSWDGMPDHFTGVASQVNSGVSGEINSMSGNVIGSLDGMASSGVSSINSLSSGSTSEFDSMMNALISDAEAINSGVTDSFTGLADTGISEMSELESGSVSSAESTSSGVNSALSDMSIDSITAFNDLVDGARDNFNQLNSTVVDAMANLDSCVQTGMSEMLTAAQEAFSAMNEAATSSFDQMKGAAESSMSSVGTIVVNEMSKAKTAVQEGCNAMVSTWNNMHFSTPHIPMPHISASGSFNPTANPPSVPSFSVSWYKEGAILDGATIFGAMGGKLLGGGEAGREAVLPVDKLRGYVEQGVISAFDKSGMGDTERNFTFNVTINATNSAANEGRMIAETLYREFARQERNWS